MTGLRSLALVAVLATAPAARAEQFVLLDVTFTYTKQDADTSKPSKSHYYVKADKLNPDRPRDWTAPVDYRRGTVHIRTEVIDKPPGGAPTTWTMCYIPNKGRGNGYGCTGSGVFRAAGVYERDVPMTSFWENDSIVWAEGIKQVDLVIKDDSGGAGHAHKRPDPEKFFPTRVRITMVQVSAGSKYDPKLVPGRPPGPAAEAAKPEECCGATPPAPPDGPAPDPLADLQGTWAPESIQIGAKTTPAESLQSIRLVIAGDAWTMATPAPRRSRIRLDPSMPPGHLDLIDEVGGRERVTPCLYELKGDKLVVCRPYMQAAPKRPEKIEPGGDFVGVAVYRREKR